MAWLGDTCRLAALRVGSLDAHVVAHFRGASRSQLTAALHALLPQPPLPDELPDQLPGQLPLPEQLRAPTPFSPPRTIPARPPNAFTLPSIPVPSRPDRPELLQGRWFPDRACVRPAVVCGNSMADAWSAAAQQLLPGSYLPTAPAIDGARPQHSAPDGGTGAGSLPAPVRPLAPVRPQRSALDGGTGTGSPPAGAHPQHSAEDGGTGAGSWSAGARPQHSAVDGGTGAGSPPAKCSPPASASTCAPRLALPLELLTPLGTPARTPLVSPTPNRRQRQPGQGSHAAGDRPPTQTSVPVCTVHPSSHLLLRQALVFQQLQRSQVLARQQQQQQQQQSVEAPYTEHCPRWQSQQLRQQSVEATDTEHCPRWQSAPNHSVLDHALALRARAETPSAVRVGRRQADQLKKRQCSKLPGWSKRTLSRHRPPLALPDTGAFPCSYTSR